MSTALFAMTQIVAAYPREHHHEGRPTTHYNLFLTNGSINHIFSCIWSTKGISTCMTNKISTHSKVKQVHIQQTEELGPFGNCLA